MSFTTTIASTQVAQEAPSPIVLGKSGNIPIIDFASFLDGSRKTEVGAAMLSSFKTVGFVYIVNHGIPKGKVDTMFDFSKKFFRMPEEKKMLAPHPPGGMPHRGYSSVGLEKVFKVDEYEEGKAEELTSAKLPDQKESFDLGRENDMYQPNIWLPDGVLDGFKESCIDFYWSCDKAKLAILSALAIGLGIDETFFDSNHGDSDCQLRLIRYPSVSAKTLQDPAVSRISAHSDFGSITLLLQDEVGGLEVEDPNNKGVFVPCPPVKDGLIVNAGDFLMRWSNDQILSTVHRVRAPPNSASVDGMTPERYSIPFFCSPDFTKTVECLPGTYSETNPPRYAPISAYKYITDRLNADY